MTVVCITGGRDLSVGTVIAIVTAISAVGVSCGGSAVMGMFTITRTGRMWLVF